MGFMIKAEGSPSHTPEPSHILETALRQLFPDCLDALASKLFVVRYLDLLPHIKCLMYANIFQYIYISYIYLSRLLPAPYMLSPTHSPTFPAACLFSPSSRDSSFSTQWAVCSFITSLLHSPVRLSLHCASRRRATLGFHYSTSQSSSWCPLCGLIGSNTQTHTGVSYLKKRGGNLEKRFVVCKQFTYYAIIYAACWCGACFIFPQIHC